MDESSPKSSRRTARGRLAIVVAAAVAAVAAGGCDVHENADLANGKQLFTESCGSCHVLTEAGSEGTQGPDLDASFAQARRDGMDRDTVEGVVQRQIAFSQGGQMPNNLVRGQEAEDVAAYVASVAGVEGIKAKPLVAAGGPGAQLFSSQGCGSCHVMEAAGSSGAVGPNLDKTLAGKDRAYVLEAIVNPDARVASGYAKGVMPGDYEGKLSKKELAQLVDFILKSTK